MKLQIKPATAQECVYGKCREPAVGELRGHFYLTQNDGDGWPMCAQHIRPEAHPKDLHGKLYRWTIVRGA